MADPAEAVEFLRLVSEAEGSNRAESLEDLRFRFGDQWPVEIQNSRSLESRPCLTINETDAYIRKIENQQRQQRPRMNPHPVGSKASIETAKTLKGLCRHIEVNSDADNAYDLGFSFAITMGFGYWRVVTDYVREDSFDQDIYIRQITNPFSVAFDPNSHLPDGSDSEKALITDVMSKTAFAKEYPGASIGGQFTERMTGDANAEWMMKEDIRLAEYFYVDRVKAELVKLSDGTILYGSSLPANEILQAARISIVGTRPTWKRSVKWCKQTAFEILEEKTLPGRWIPIVPVYGVQVVIGDKRKRFGLVRFARDPQTMVNFWQTTLTEMAAAGPRATWLIAEGQDEGHENEFSQSNIKRTAVLRYKTVDVDGKPAPPPQRIEPTMVDAAALTNAQIAADGLKRVLGVFDPQVKTDGNKSGKAITAEKMQSEESNYNYYDNLTRSIKHTARIILDLTPTIYDTTRVMRIIGEDDKPDLVILNEKKTIEGVEKILNDVTVGEYDVVMDTGPGYNTKRQEAVEVFTSMLGTPLGEKIAVVADDLIVRNLDVPGADAIADRLAAANPLAQIDDKSDIPPRAQMMIKHLQGQLQQAGQQMQEMGLELKFKHGIQEMKEHGATVRERLKADVKREDVRTIAATKQHDTEVRALTAQNVEELKGMVQLLLHHLDTKNFDKEIEQRDKEAKSKADESAVSL